MLSWQTLAREEEKATTVKHTCPSQEEGECCKPLELSGFSNGQGSAHNRLLASVSQLARLYWQVRWEYNSGVCQGLSLQGVFPPSPSL